MSPFGGQTADYICTGVMLPPLIRSILVVGRGEEKSWGKQSALATVDPAEPDGHRSHSYARSLSHISECSIDGILLTNKGAAESQEEMSLSSGMSISDIEMEISRTPELAASDSDLLLRRLSFSKKTVTVTADGASITPQNAPPTSDLAAFPATTADVDDGTYVARYVAVEEEQVGVEADECDGAVDSGLEEALGAVASSLDDYRGQFPELQLLEDELKLLQVNLKVRFLRVGRQHHRKHLPASR